MSAAEEFVARMMAFAPGDWIVCRGVRVPIIEVRHYLPGHHDGSPIRDSARLLLRAVEYLK